MHMTWNQILQDGDECKKMWGPDASSGVKGLLIMTMMTMMIMVMMMMMMTMHSSGYKDHATTGKV